MSKKLDLTLPHTGLALCHNSTYKKSCEIVRIKQALLIMAEIIAEGSEQYLPIFERLEYELDKKKSQDEALKRARNLSFHRSFEHTI